MQQASGPRQGTSKPTTKQPANAKPTTPTVTTVNAKNIKFSQSSVNGPQVKALEQSMKQKGWQGSPVDVVETKPGNLVTLDNKRVLAASRTDTPVQAVIHAADTPLPTNYVERLLLKMEEFQLLLETQS
ncbi:MAG TPA: hypothetical protein VIN08_13410 [Ohtaekwangia sp.]|uniref:hypothetical protein n=1 Tax=Ohtaekwangia sp. TaxID=2066019 RepID=UPI002F958F24